MAKKTSTKSTKRGGAGFTDVERAAMRERARELKAEARRGPRKADGESAVLATIAAMPSPDRGIAERLHAIVRASAPALSPNNAANPAAAMGGPATGVPVIHSPVGGAPRNPRNWLLSAMRRLVTAAWSALPATGA